MAKIAILLKKRFLSKLTAIFFVGLFSFQSISLPVHSTAHALQSFTQGSSPSQPIQNDQHESNCPLCDAIHTHFVSLGLPITFTPPTFLISAASAIQNAEPFSFSILAPTARGPPHLI